MKKALAAASLLALTVFVAGCGDTADSLLEDHIDNMNELAKAVEEDAPESQIEEIKKRLEETGKKLEELEVSDEEKKRLEEKYEDDLKDAYARLMKAMMGKAGRQFGKQVPQMPGFGN